MGDTFIVRRKFDASMVRDLRPVFDLLLAFLSTLGRVGTVAGAFRGLTQGDLREDQRLYLVKVKEYHRLAKEALSEEAKEHYLEKREFFLEALFEDV